MSAGAGNESEEQEVTTSCTLHHLQLDVRRFLQHARPADYERTFTDADGNPIPWHLARQMLAKELELGHFYLPVGERCDAFDYSTGCAGHPL